MRVVHILNGPNLNLLGTREPEIYGTTTLADIGAACERLGAEHGLSVSLRQTNSEGTLIDQIHDALNGVDGLIVNPGGLTHTSVSLRDALAAFRGPILEVHLSNIHRREEFRHRSLISPVVSGVICGLGALGYELAVSAMARLLEGQAKDPR